MVVVAQDEKFIKLFFGVNLYFSDIYGLCGIFRVRGNRKCVNYIFVLNVPGGKFVYIWIFNSFAEKLISKIFRF